MDRISEAFDAQAWSSLAVAYMAYSAKEFVLSWKADKYFRVDRGRIEDSEILYSSWFLCS